MGLSLVASALVGLLFLAITLFVVGGYVLHYFDSANSVEQVPLEIERYAKAMVREWAAALTFVLLTPLGWLPWPRSKPYNPAGGPPIVLVPGYMANRSCMFALYWRLRRQGFNNIYPITLTSDTWDAMAQQLAQILQDISLGAERRGVIGVGHSRGGLLLRWCAMHLENIPLAKTIAIASPHLGTKTAVLSSAAVVQLRPGKLAWKKDFAEPELVSIYSALDQMIIPSSSAIVGARTYEITCGGHSALLFSNAVANTLIDEIRRSP